MGSDSTMISDLAVCCRKNQPPLMSFYNLGSSAAIAVNRVSFPLPPAIPSPMLQQDGLPDGPTQLVWRHPKAQLGELIWIKDILPFPFLPRFFCRFFIPLYHLPSASHYAALQTGVLAYLGGMMLSVRGPTRSLNCRLRLCLNPTLILFIIAVIIII